MFSAWPAADASWGDSSETVFWWLVRLRWLALLGVAATLMIAGPMLDRLPAGSTPWLWAVAATLGAYNGALAFLGPRRHASWLTPFGVQLTLDCIALALLVHLAGGIDNPFLPLFVLHVVNANIVLSGRGALGVLVLAISLLAAIVIGEGMGVLPHHCLRQAGQPCSGAALPLRALATLGGLTLTLVASSLFTRFLTAQLRRGRRKLMATVEELNAEKEQLAQARAAVETERGRLSAIIDCMGDAVTFSSPSGDVTFSNQPAKELSRAGGPALARPSLERLFEQLAGSPSASPRSNFERGGRSFEATHSLVRSTEGETLGLVMVARDVTDRLAMEKHLMREEQMSVVGKLAATVAHEINNPIGVVCLYSQHALATLEPDSPLYDHLETIRRNADSCRKIVGGLLNLAKARAPERRPLDLRQLCREVVEAVTPLAAGAAVRVSSGFPIDVPIWARADAGMLRQAVLNLTLNALDAAGRGGDVWVSAYETQDGGATACAIEVSDTGGGIGEEQIERIFQPFFTTKETGTGLGLSVAENVVKSHEGRIDVKSVVGSGTVFRIVLPDHERASSRAAPRRADHLARPSPR